MTRQVFGGYAVRVQVDCTQRLDRRPHGGSGRATAPTWEARGRDTGRTCQRAPAPQHKQSPLDGATSKDDGSGDSRTWSLTHSNPSAAVGNEVGITSARQGAP
jgi:hypothetical protein